MVHSAHRFAATLDLNTIVRAEGDLRGVEVFLASHFAPPFTNALIFAATDAQPHFILSLFGRDIKAGETARAQSRLAFRGPLADPKILQLYSSYADELRRND